MRKKTRSISFLFYFVELPLTFFFPPLSLSPCPSNYQQNQAEPEEAEDDGGALLSGTLPNR